MESVIVQRPASPEDGVPESWRLGPGDEIRFGRGGAGSAVEVALGDPGVPRVAGEIAAAEDYWLLTNLGAELTYVVENPEGGGEFVKVPPGRTRAPIPFEFARLMVPVATGTADLLVFAPEHLHLDPARPQDGERTARSFSLDESAKYFLVLVALCEPRLRAPSTTAVPSLGAVVQRLRDVPGCEELTRTAVEFHVDYLAQHKLRVRERERDDPGSDKQDRLAHRRQALVSLALRFGLVDADHLGLLPSRPSRGDRERT
ncbi:MAG: serine/threonine protein kinase [Solirubrobacteraceae bacterium]